MNQIALELNENVLMTCIEHDWAYATKNPTRQNWSALSSFIEGIWNVCLFGANEINNAFEDDVRVLRKVAFFRSLNG